MTEPGWSAPMGADYTNSVNVSFSQWDVRLDFQVTTPVPGGAEGAASPPAPVARLVMSPMHAKVLAAMMSNSVRIWEQKFGALPDTEVLSPGLSERLAQITAENVPQPPGRTGESE